MRVLVWGTGAIGGTVAAYLARAGHAVTCVDVVEEHVRAIRERGLQVTGPIDSFVARPEACLPEALAGEFETALLCVRSGDTAGAVAALRPRLAGTGHVVSLQNGLNEPAIAGIVGRERTIGAFINFAAEYLEPGVVLYGGRGAVVIGELDGVRSPRVEALRRLLQDFDEAAAVSPDIMGYLWGKLAYGGFLRITAVADAGIADGLEAPEHRPLFVALAREILAVAAREGIHPHGFNGFDPEAFAPGAPPEALGLTFEAMIRFNRGSALTHASVWRDLAVRKRRTDTAAQLAPMLRIAAGHGIPTPVTSALVATITAIEEGHLAVGPRAVEHLRAAVA